MGFFVSNEIKPDVGTKPHNLLKLPMPETLCKAQIPMLVPDLTTTLFKLFTRKPSFKT